MSDQSEEETLEQRAARARTRLMATVDLLDQKRESFKHPMKLIARRMPEPTVLVGAIVAAGAIGYWAGKRREMSRWVEPAPRPAPTFWGEVVRKSAKALIVFAVVQAGKRALSEFQRAALGKDTAPAAPTRPKERIRLFPQRPAHMHH